MYRICYLLLLMLLVACTPSQETETITTAAPDAVSEPSASTPAASELPVADIVSVAVTGEANNYTFAVTIRSADTGCEQYTDWWEVVDVQTGELLYRRILVHSHVDEQPFTRSGGPVAIASEQQVVVRGHMGGIQSRYGGQILQGSVESGFSPAEDSLPGLETVEPLPEGCTF